MSIFKNRRFPWRAIAFVGILLATSNFVIANEATEICEQSAQSASKETGVPFAVLMAIGKTESGRYVNDRFVPWPWTINTQGKGQFMASQEALYQAAKSNISNGISSFDVGCFQINYKWHGQNFDSLRQMTNPMANARYAALFLRKLYIEFGNWDSAAGAFHSRTEAHAERYKKVFRKNLAPGPRVASRTIRAVGPGEVRENPFPLLKVGDGTIALGSLVPASLDQANSALGSLVR